MSIGARVGARSTKSPKTTDDPCIGPPFASKSWLLLPACCQVDVHALSEHGLVSYSTAAQAMPGPLSQ